MKKTLKEFAKSKGYKEVVKKFRVRSKSEPGTYHLVEVYLDGSLGCDCVAGMFKQKTCRHRKIVQEYLSR